jgi:hypothetical protein
MRTTLLLVLLLAACSGGGQNDGGPVMPPAPCGSCTGCCLGTECKAGTANAACGAANGTCVACSDFEACQGGRCVAACDDTTCPTGCCHEGTCYPGNGGYGTCGGGGAACAMCSGATQTCAARTCVRFVNVTLEYWLGACGTAAAPCTITVRLTSSDFATLQANPDYSVCSYSETAPATATSPAAYTVRCQNGYRSDWTGTCVITYSGTCCPPPAYANTSSCGWSPPGAF